MGGGLLVAPVSLQGGRWVEQQGEEAASSSTLAWEVPAPSCFALAPQDRNPLGVQHRNIFFVILHVIVQDVTRCSWFSFLGQRDAKSVCKNKIGP